jgi:hypothetical protein
MDAEPTGEGALEQKREHLESGVLQLTEVPDSLLSDSSKTYQTALSTQAVPIVDLLSQIKSNGVERKKPVLGDFSSTMGGAYEVRAKIWHSDLSQTSNRMPRVWQRHWMN